MLCYVCMHVFVYAYMYVCMYYVYMYISRNMYVCILLNEHLCVSYERLWYTRQFLDTGYMTRCGSHLSNFHFRVLCVGSYVHFANLSSHDIP
jgi:hypothetical protein